MGLLTDLLGDGAGGVSRVTRVHRTATQAIADASLVAVQFNAEGMDDLGMHDNATNNTRLTVPAGYAGRYHLVGSTAWAANNAGYRTALWRLNGTTVIARGAQVGFISGASVINQAVAIEELAVGDYVELIVYQTSGASLDLSSGIDFTYAAAHFLGPAPA